jgi:hypothetical protein
MPQGKGTYGSQVGRPSKKKNSTDNYEQTQKGTGQNSTDNMNDGPIDRQMNRSTSLPRISTDVRDMLIQKRKPVTSEVLRKQREERRQKRKTAILKSQSIKKIKKQSKK